MKRLLRTIATSVKKALRVMFTGLRYGAAAALMPVGALVDLIFGRSEAELPEPDEVMEETHEKLDLEQVKAPNQLRDPMTARLLAKVRPYTPCFEYACMPSAKRHKFDLSSVPADAASWCRKLTDIECQRVKHAGLMAMIDHVTSKKTIPGVALVRKPLRSFVDDLTWDGVIPDPTQHAATAIAEGRAAQRQLRLH